MWFIATVTTVRTFKKLGSTIGSGRFVLIALATAIKAILMRRQGKNRTDLCTEISECQHDVNKLLDCLSVQKKLRLPGQLSIKPIKGKNGDDERKFTTGEVNQMWRYGGCCKTAGITDQDLEEKLLEIVNWIDGELKRP